MPCRVLCVAMDIRLDIDSIPEDDSAFLVQPNARKDSEQHWPFIFWIYLKTIGLYHNGKQKFKGQVPRFWRQLCFLLNLKVKCF